MKIINMLCPQCGASLKVDLDNEHAECEYCGYQIIIEQEDTAEEIREKERSKAYGYHKGKLEAEAEAAKNTKRRNTKIKLITFCIPVLVLLLLFGFAELTKETINPFDYIEVSFEGRDGDGELILDVVDSSGEIAVYDIEYTASKESDLFLGETITINATSDTYRLEETTQTYIVEGLDEYLKDLADIPEDALEVIHTRGEDSFKFYLDSYREAGMVEEIKPVKLILLTDGKQYNDLYDVFEIRFLTRNGERTLYMVANFYDVIIRDGEQVSIDMTRGMARGGLVSVSGASYITGYETMEDIIADLLTDQERYLEMTEKDL